jgi:hypothetical protein
MGTKSSDCIERQKPYIIAVAAELMMICFRSIALKVDTAVDMEPERFPAAVPGA